MNDGSSKSNYKKSAPTFAQMTLVLLAIFKNLFANIDASVE
jgi:hypothetical protein